MREIKVEIEVLEFLQKTLLVIKDTIIRVIKNLDIEQRVKDDLKDILITYRDLIQAINSMLRRRNKEINNLSVGEKMATYMSIKFNLGKKAEVEGVASMLIEDIKLSSNQIEKMLSEYTKISKTIINLSNRIYLTNTKSVKMLEKYIK